MEHLREYRNFLFEADGFGRDYFVKQKDGKTSKYFFKLAGEEATICFILSIGKLSRKITIDTPENSYAVISIETIKESIMDDYLVNDTEYKSKDREIFTLTKSEILRFYSIVSEAIKDYLENNPKVAIIYDETTFNLDVNTKEFINIARELMDSWSYGKWSIQDGPVSKTIIYSRRDHE